MLSVFRKIKKFSRTVFNVELCFDKTLFWSTFHRSRDACTMPKVWKTLPRERHWHRPPELATSKPFSSTQYNVYLEKDFVIPRCASSLSNGLMVPSVSSDGVYRNKTFSFVSRAINWTGIELFNWKPLKWWHQAWAQTNADLSLGSKMLPPFSTANKAIFLFPSVTHDRVQWEKVIPQQILKARNWRKWEVLSISSF